MDYAAVDRQGPEGPRRGVRVSAIVGGLLAAAVAGFALFALLGGSEKPQSPPLAASGSSGDETTGAAFAEQMGIVAHPYDSSMKLEQGADVLKLNGSPLQGCETPANGDQFGFTIVLGNLYCFSAPTESEAWVISQRLNGNVPSDQEIADHEAEMSDAPSN
jgi:hypothetical protein